MATQYWLLKSEPDAFGIEDLRRVRREPWTGVRNYQARNLMRDAMRVGDEAIFYHSNAKPSGAAGVCRIVKTGVVDPTQFDPESPYFDPTSSREAPRWVCVDVEFVSAFAEVIPLAQLRDVAALEGMELLRKGSRLSVQPMTRGQFSTITKLAAQLAMPTRAAARSHR